MTVIEAFKTFKSELELPDRKQQQASIAQQEIRSEIAKHIYVANSFLTGSYARYTKIDPLNDIDAFLVRNGTRVPLSTSGGVGPSQAIDQLATAVSAAYPSATVKKQSRSVNVQLAAYPFGFDLVPAWLRSPNGYWIPDTDVFDWIPTDPDAHAKLLTDANEVSKLKLKPLIKMLKHWSRNNFDLFRSFHIELICANLVLSGKLAPDISFQLGVATILIHLKTYAGAQMMDPTYGASRVDKELSPDELTKLRSLIDYDARNAIEALRLETAGDQAAAIERWKHIFVAGFPK
jgi:SMODS domain-containing protein